MVRLGWVAGGRVWVGVGSWVVFGGQKWSCITG